MTPHLPSGLTVTAHQGRQAVRLLAACALAGVPTALLNIPDWYWSLITAVAVMQPDLRHTLTSGRDRMIATVIGALVGLLLIYLRLQGLPDTPLFIVGMLPLGLLTGMRPNLRLSCTTLIVVFLLPSGADPYGRALFRVVDILAGVVACIVVSLTVFRHENDPKPSSP